MSTDLAPDEQPLSSVDDLVGYFRAAERPASEHQVGLEHEKLVYTSAGKEVPFEGPGGIQAILDGLATRGYAGSADVQGGPVVGLSKGRATVSLEPGGQLEFSGSPKPTAREAHRENADHLKELVQVAAKLGMQPVALGYRPFGTVAEMPWMPKRRYETMRRTLGARGPLALDMMVMTATGQVSIDWSDEADCAAKVGVAARISPLLVALYANSPLVRGKPSPFLSYRSHVWTDVDSARCGYPACMVDGTLSYRAYVEWALDAPLLFLRRRGGYATPSLTFRALLKDGFEGKPAVWGDWVDHLSTLFPEVRMKRVIEIRSADCVSLSLTGALPALARGLFYSKSALEEAGRLMPALPLTEHLARAEAARRKGLRATFGKRSAAELARELLRIARRGLTELDHEDCALLEPLESVAQSGRSPAENVLAQWDRSKDAAALLAAFPALR